MVEGGGFPIFRSQLYCLYPYSDVNSIIFTGNVRFTRVADSGESHIDSSLGVSEFLYYYRPFRKLVLAGYVFGLLGNASECATWRPYRALLMRHYLDNSPKACQNEFSKRSITHRNHATRDCM